MMNSVDLKNHGEPARRPRIIESKSVRRRQLIDAAIECIAKHGISGTTMSKVTEIAELSLGLVNYHFKSKKRLLEETLSSLAVEHRVQWQKNLNESKRNDLDRLLAIVDSHFYPRICSHKKLAVWFAFFGEAGNRGVYREIVDDIDDERLVEIIRLCQNIRVAGRYTDIDPKQVALTLEGLFDGLWLNMLLYPNVYNAEVSKKLIYTFLAAMFPRHFDRSRPCKEGML